jgi:hypothetical protein
MWAAPLACVIASCFSEGPTEPAGTPETLLVVQGVVRADQAQQWVLVERTLNGTVPGFTNGFVPGGEVSTPVEAATVTISNVSLPTDPCGPAVPLLEGTGPDGLRQPGVYFSTSGCPTVRPGDTLDLLVLNGDERATGRTVVPGTRSMTVEAGGLTAAVPGPTLEFNRDTDTLRVSVDPISGRSLIVEIGERRFVESKEFLSLESSQFWVDAPDLTLPGDLQDVFADFDEDDPIPPVFVAGRLHRVTVAYADQNFFDQGRSENTELTGRGFINSIDGGLGYFGSMTAAFSNLRVVGEIDDPIEGLYSMTGDVDGVPVALDWELYFNGVDEEGLQEFSSYVDGTWVFGAYDAWAPGDFSGNFMRAFLAQPTGMTSPEGGPEVAFWELSGAIASTGTSTVNVLLDGDQVGTLTATRR